MSTDPSKMQVSDAVRRLNPDVFKEIPGRKTWAVKDIEAMVVSVPQSMAHGSESMTHPPTFRVPDVRPKRRLRQDTKGPNKLELEFEEFLRGEWKDAVVLAQAVTLKLGNGVRYTPDFVVVIQNAKRVPAMQVLAFETKGFMREDAAVKIKVAAHQYPWMKFNLVTKRRKKDGGGWSIEEVFP